jgi:hypothetical protein
MVSQTGQKSSNPWISREFGHGLVDLSCLTDHIQVGLGRGAHVH